MASHRTPPARRVSAAALVAALWAAPGCGDPSPRILASHETPVRTRSIIAVSSGPLTEDDKVARLINVARASGLVFLRARRELTAGEFGDHMLTTYRRHRDEIDKARDLIERATRQKNTSKPVLVRLPDGKEAAARDWLHARLDELERGQASAVTTREAGQPTTRSLRISDVLTIIDGADAVFIVPQRKGPPKEMNGRAFASMLQQKWQWVGRDIEDVDAFVSEIASDSFTAFEPYRIRHEDGRAQSVADWLAPLLEQKREALATAQVGSL